MNVLKEYKGYQLVERYDKTYIRFWGGQRNLCLLMTLEINWLFAKAGETH